MLRRRRRECRRREPTVLAGDGHAVDRMERPRARVRPGPWYLTAARGSLAAERDTADKIGSGYRDGLVIVPALVHDTGTLPQCHLRLWPPSACRAVGRDCRAHTAPVTALLVVSCCRAPLGQRPLLTGLRERRNAGQAAKLQGSGSRPSEPPRVRRRPFGLSHAAMAGCSNMA